MPVTRVLFVLRLSTAIAFVAGLLLRKKLPHIYVHRIWAKQNPLKNQISPCSLTSVPSAGSTASRHPAWHGDWKRLPLFEHTGWYWTSEQSQRSLQGKTGLALGGKALWLAGYEKRFFFETLWCFHDVAVTDVTNVCLNDLTMFVRTPIIKDLSFLRAENWCAAGEILSLSPSSSLSFSSSSSSSSGCRRHNSHRRVRSSSSRRRCCCCCCYHSIPETIVSLSSRQVIVVADQGYLYQQ